MISVVVDHRVGAEGDAIAAHLIPLLKSAEFADAYGTLYVGSGSNDLIAPDHDRPHILLPLTSSRWPDPLVRQQIAAADAVILVDHAELRRLRKCLDGPLVLVLEPPPRGGVIRCETPREATEVARFARACPVLYDTLTHLHATPNPFAYSNVAEVVVEASLAADVSWGNR